MYIICNILYVHTHYMEIVSNPIVKKMVNSLWIYLFSAKRNTIACVCMCVCIYMCVCVCMCVKEREGERGGGREGEKERE